MLLYITAEDVFGDGAPRGQGPRPLHRIPETVAGLFDLGLRHHIRSAALLWPKDDGLDSVPDWKLDRLAIRVALQGRERMGVEPGTRVAIFGRLGWPWPVADFAAMGFGAVPVGLAHDLSDDALVDVLRQADARVVFATDPESVARAQRLRREGHLGTATLVGEDLPEDEGQMPLSRVLELGSILDTAERAQSFRAVSRQIAPDGEALWHASPEGLVRLTHREAMAFLEPWLREHPAREGDVAYLDGPRVTLAVRLAMAAFVGDGLTTIALGHGARTDKEIATVRPHKMVLSGDWLEEACKGHGPRWPAGLDRPWARRRLQERLGGRLRWVETGASLGDGTARALEVAGVTHRVTDQGIGRGTGDTVTPTVH